MKTYPTRKKALLSLCLSASGAALWLLGAGMNGVVGLCAGLGVGLSASALYLVREMRQMRTLHEKFQAEREDFTRSWQESRQQLRQEMEESQRIFAQAGEMLTHAQHSEAQARRILEAARAADKDPVKAALMAYAMAQAAEGGLQGIMRSLLRTDMPSGES